MTTVFLPGYSDRKFSSEQERREVLASLPGWQKPTPGQGGITQDAPSRAASQPTKAPDMSAYAPSKAQPVQQPSTGTPYGDITPEGRTRGIDDNGGVPFMRPSAPQPGQSQNPYANMAPGVYYGGQQIPGNQQQALATAMAQRDAMATLVNNNNLKYQMANAFGQDLGQPQFDYGSAMQQAQNMVANGFYNPFTQYYNQTTDPLAQLGNYAPPTAYNPQQPFPPIGGFGVQQPQAPQAPQRPEYSPTRVPGSEWDQDEQAWRLPSKPQQPASAAPGSSPIDWRKSWQGDRWGWEGPGGMVAVGTDAPWADMQPTTRQPRVSPTTPTSGNWIQRADGQWEETQPKMYGGRDPVLKSPSRRQEWIDAGMPGYDPQGPATMVTGSSQIDGTGFGVAAEAAAYDKWLRSQGGGRDPVLKARELRPQPGLIDPRGMQPTQGGRYVPVDPASDGGGVSYRGRQANAARFISELEDTNPATWSDQQWEDYARAQQDRGLMDSGGYYRGQDGRVYRGGGFTTKDWAEKMANSPIGRDAKRDQYGNWGGDGGGQYSPRVFPGTALPIQPPSQGTPYKKQQSTDPQSARDAAYKKAMDQKQKDDRMRQMKQALAVSMKQLYPNDWQQRVKQVYG